MKYFVAAAVAASLLAGTAAIAQPYDNRNNSQWNDNNRDRDGRYDRDDRNDRNGRWDNNRRGDGWNRGRWEGKKAHPRWSRGDRFSQYGHRGWVVNDYRSHRLRKPPRGYHWVRSNDEFLLVAVTSGIIAQIVLGNR